MDAFYFVKFKLCTKLRTPIGHVKELDGRAKIELLGLQKIYMLLNPVSQIIINTNIEFCGYFQNVWKRFEF